MSDHYGRDTAVLNGFSEVMLCDFTSSVSVASFANLEHAKGVPPLMCESLSVGSLA